MHNYLLIEGISLITISLLLGVIYIAIYGWFKPQPQTKCKPKDLKKLIHKLMATQEELVVQLQGIKQNLVDIGTAVEKVGSETDKNLLLIKDLQDALNNQANASQELVDAVAAVSNQSIVLKTGVQIVDDKVPDVG